MAVHVHVSDDAVDIRFTGIDKWITFNPSGQHLAMADITGARVDAAHRGRGRVAAGGSAAGTGPTGWRRAGSPMKDRKGVRELWCVYRDDRGARHRHRLDKPCRVVLQHPDRHDLAWYIGERLARR